MKKVIVTFYRDGKVIRTEMFSNEMEADMYVANESLDYDSYTMRIEEDDAV